MIRDIVDFILPSSCDICSGIADGDSRMDEYRQVYRSIYKTDTKLHICGKCLSLLCPQSKDKRWFLCLSEPYAGDPIPSQELYIPFPYEGFMSMAIPRIKFGKRIEVARFLGIAFGELLLADDINADLIVPIPLSDKRMAQRGFNQAAEMVYPASRIAKLVYGGDVLLRNRDTQRQTEMKDREGRIDNVSGAFEVNPEWDINGLTIVLTDDVATTGFTLHEACEVLYKAGAAKVLCAAISGNRQVKNAESF